MNCDFLHTCSSGFSMLLQKAGACCTVKPVVEQVGIIWDLGKKKFDPLTHEYWAAKHLSTNQTHRKLRQEDHMFQASLDYMEPCLKNQKATRDLLLLLLLLGSPTGLSGCCSELSHL